MARNGSGTYNLLNNTAYPGVNGVTMTAADWNAFALDIANALTGSVAADGQTPLTGNLNANNNKLTGLAAGSATGQSLRWEQLFSQGTEADIASAGTCDIGAQNTNFLRVTGTTTITSFGTNYNGPRFLRFSGALTLTHNASSLILPGGANIVTAAGDSCLAIPISGGWYVSQYERASKAGAVLQEVVLTDAGSSTSQGSLTNITASTKTITPKSANSTLVIECSFQATISAAGAGTNAIGAFRLYNNTTTADIGGEYTVGVESGSGTAMTTYAPVVVRATVSNSATTAVGFLLRARYASAATTVAGTGQVWTIREIQN